MYVSLILPRRGTCVTKYFLEDAHDATHTIKGAHVSLILPRRDTCVTSVLEGEHMCQ